MKKLLLLFTLTFVLLTNAFGQGMTYTIDLNDENAINRNINVLVQTETDFWATSLNLDSTLTAKLKTNNFSIYQQYIQVMKSFNYTMENILLVEQKNFKDRQKRFMKMFLNEKQFKDYQVIVNRTGKKRLKKYKDEPSTEIQKLRVQAAGWNVVHHTINFK